MIQIRNGLARFLSVMVVKLIVVQIQVNYRQFRCMQIITGL
jgi:hypothetical protein